MFPYAESMSRIAKKGVLKVHVKLDNTCGQFEAEQLRDLIIETLDYYAQDGIETEGGDTLTIEIGEGPETEGDEEE